MSESILFKHSIEFLAVANEFVKFCETDAVEIKNSENFIDIASKLLSLLYLKALFLESPKNIEDIELEYNFEFVDAMRYEAVKSEVANVLGDFDVYV
ncbi:MAG: DUF5063 domain-containing protein, partial [Bacteroidales bacterium]|nr:DUF5063 domain-containing protein [Bacteroidales bacterium]